MNIRWERGTQRAREINGGRDFGILDIVDEENVLKESLLFREATLGEDGRLWIEIRSTQAEDNTSRINQYRDIFLDTWTDQGLLQIPEEDLPPAGSVRKILESKKINIWSDGQKRRKGEVAFYNALCHIENASDFIIATDISDLKEGIDAIYEDSVYKSWYEMTSSRIGHVRRFRRIYVVKRSVSSIDQLIQCHLDHYFDGRGASYSGSQVHVLFADNVITALKTTDKKRAQAWFDSHSHLVRHLRESGQWRNSNLVDVYRRLLVRDYLVTEGMIYDYRSETASFELDRLQNYLVSGDHAKSLVEEWQDISVELLNRVEGITGTTHEELLASLEMAKKNCE
jgi:hypothetical protein